MATVSLFFITVRIYDGRFDDKYGHRGNLHDRRLGYNPHDQLKSKCRLTTAERSGRPSGGRRSSRTRTCKSGGADANKWLAGRDGRSERFC
jgi:hypothetical protein